MIDGDLIAKFISTIKEPIFKTKFETLYNDFAMANKLNRNDYYLYKSVIKFKLIELQMIRF